MNEKEIIAKHFSALGKKGGKKGGTARMASMTDEERADLAKKAAAARWKDKPMKTATKKAAKKATKKTADPVEWQETHGKAVKSKATKKAEGRESHGRRSA